MSVFTSVTADVLTTFDPGSARSEGLIKVARGSATQSMSIMSDSGRLPDLSNQFWIFQLNPKATGPAVLESSKVDPKIDGSPDEPDVLVGLEMLSLHLGAGEDIEPDTRATLRLNFGKDESSTDRKFDTAFWSIAAGLDLYNSATKKRANNKDFRSDLQKAFGNRPIEIPGGLGRLSFEIVKHKDPRWWQRVFGFLQGQAGTSLISVLGFPAVATAAIDVLDELLSRLAESDPQPLFRSQPMRLALSKYARDEFTAGGERVTIGALSRGLCIMSRGRDRDVLNDADVGFDATYGKLVPRNVGEADLLAGRFDDPLEDVTYAVFRVGTKSTKLDPTFNFG
jgi:hypothetical protein